MKDLVSRLFRFVSRQMTRYSPYSSEGTLFEIDLNQSRPAKIPSVDGDFRVVSEAQLSAFQADLPSQLLEYFRERFSVRKDTMIGYFVSDKLVYWGWVSFGDHYFEPELNASITIPSNAGYIYDTQTVPSYRRKGIHAAGTFKLLEVIRQNGKERALLLILKNNDNALKAFSRFEPKKLQNIGNHSDPSH